MVNGFRKFKERFQGFENQYVIIGGTACDLIMENEELPFRATKDIDIVLIVESITVEFGRQFWEYVKEAGYEHLNKSTGNAQFYRFIAPKSKEYPYMITRISDDRYIIKMENEKPYGMGVFIDIYPYDGLGTTEKEAVTYGMKGDRLSSLCYQSTREHFAIETTTSLFRKIIKYPVFIGSKLIGKDYFQKKLNQLVKLKEYEDSNYIGCVVWLSGGKKEIFLRKWFDETVMVPFEKYQFRVPKDYDEVLRHTYGDYMQLPPEKDRIGHHYFKAYRKDE